MAENQEGQSTQPSNNVEGWPSLVLRNDGQIYTSDGIVVTPNHYVGLEPWHKGMFIDYERTFGRGIAKIETHNTRGERNPELLDRRYGPGYAGVREDYQSIEQEYGQIMRSGSPEEAERIKQRLQEFRNKYPRLYQDVPNPNKPKPSVRIIS